MSDVGNNISNSISFHVWDETHPSTKPEIQEILEYEGPIQTDSNILLCLPHQKMSAKIQLNLSLKKHFIFTVVELLQHWQPQP